jgi:hypothetical protein
MKIICKYTIPDGNLYFSANGTRLEDELLESYMWFLHPGVLRLYTTKR